VGQGQRGRRAGGAAPARTHGGGRRTGASAWWRGGGALSAGCRRAPLVGGRLAERGLLVADRWSDAAFHRSALLFHRSALLFFFLRSPDAPPPQERSSSGSAQLAGGGLAGGRGGRGYRRLAGAYAPPCVMGASAYGQGSYFFLILLSWIVKLKG